MPSGVKLEEGWCEMATAKPKVKRMMFGGAAKGTQASMQGAAKQAAASKPGTAGPKPMQIQVPASVRSSVADSLRKAPTSGMQGAGKAASAADAYRSYTAQKNAQKTAADAYRTYNPKDARLGDAMRGLGVGAAGATRGMMKKGGAVKKKATKK